jgi:hypothetical protein
MKYERTILTVAKWTARILGFLVLASIVFIAIGEAGPNLLHGSNPLHGSLRENLLGLGLLTMMVGIVVGWKWEGIGGLLILGGFVFFAIVNHRPSLNIVTVPWLLAGLLYLGCWWMRGKVVPSGGNGYVP